MAKQGVRRVLAVLGAGVALALAGCGGGADPLAPKPSGAEGTPAGSPSGDAATGATGRIVIGSANFPESTLLAQIYAAALRAKGIQVSTKLNIGSRETYLPGLKDGSLDLMPEYSGVLLLAFDAKATAVSPEQVYAALTKALPKSLTVLEQSSAQDKDAIVVTRATAEKYRLTTIADLAPVAGKLTFGGPPEFKTRPDGIPGLATLYQVTFGTVKSLDAGGPLTVNALKSGQIDAADIFTTDPSIPANGFVDLGDPKNLFAAQNVLPLIRAEKATAPVREALNAVSAKLDTATLAQLDAMVIAEKKDPAAVASAWLTSVKLG